MTDLSPIKDLQTYMDGLGENAKGAASALRLASEEQKNRALLAMAGHIRKKANEILVANKKDMDAGEAKGLSAAMLDRLLLDAGRIEGIAGGLEAIAALPEPVGIEDKRWTRPNGLTIAKVRVPIGVIGIIYESRPNVTADAGALCVKSGNAAILRGGSESAHSSGAIHACLTAGLEDEGIPASAIQMIATTDRAAVGMLLSGLNDSVSLIIPRGGKNLIARVQADARVPVLAHLEGLCHTYVHAKADPQMAIDIVATNDIDDALAHIAQYSSGHTDAIVTGDDAAAKRFLAEVDSAICVHNASTQYADGGEFGFGAEIGIATGRIHARGPVGAEHLTTYKYAVMGTGQTRPV